MRDLLDFLGLLLLLLVGYILDLRCVVVLVGFLLLVVVLVGVRIGYLLLRGLLDPKIDGKSNELGVLLDEILEFTFLEEIGHVLLEMKNDSRTTTETVIGFVLDDGEGTSGTGAPLVLLVIVVLGDHFDFLGDEIGGIETDTELSDHRDVSSRRESLHESLGSGLGDGSEMIDQILLGHTDTAIFDRESVVRLVWDNIDAHLFLRVQDGRVGKRGVSDLVKSI